MTLVVLGYVLPTLAPAQDQYTTDGTPTGLEEEIRWRLNRGRFDSASENQARGTTYTNVPASTGPLAPHQSLTLAARHHAEDMARNNVLQHATVPGSAYYDPVTQPYFSDRIIAEGYTPNSAGENIACGFADAEAVYVAWWNSELHRQNMYNRNLREVGNGYFYWASSTYRRYYTMDLGSSSTNCFFTDTLFSDANGNSRYDQGEGIAGVAVRLFVGGAPFGMYDLSADAGSFAIPIQLMAGGTQTQVVLSNTTTAAVTLSIPRDYQAYAVLSLAAGESKVYGAFVRPTNTVNVGWRDVLPEIQPPLLSAHLSSPDLVLTWPSETGLEYQPQSTTNFSIWTSLTTNYQSGSGSNLTWTDAGALTSKGKFYRLVIRRP